MIDLAIVDDGLKLGVELHLSVLGRTPERQQDYYVVAAHKRRPPEKLISSEPMIARSEPHITPNDAARDAIAKIKAMPAPPNAEDVIAAKDSELARLRAELEAVKEQKPAKADKSAKKSD
jgi:hypothetical protein